MMKRIFGKKVIVTALAMIMLLVGASSVFAAMESEPNDTLANANYLAYGDVGTGTMNTSSDQDNYAVTVPSTGSYRALFLLQSPSAYTHYFFLYDATANQYIINAVPLSSGYVTVPFSGVAGHQYYILVGGTGGTDGKYYQVAIWPPA